MPKSLSPLRQDLTETDMLAITKGFSGALVIDSQSHHVYGQVIAISPLGALYVVPLNRTIQQIKDVVGTSNVKFVTEDLLPHPETIPAGYASNSVPDIDALQVSQREWERTFGEDPYTSFSLIKALMIELNISCDDVLGNLGVLLERLTSHGTLVSDLRNLAQKPGNSTSFAIKVATNLEAKHPGVFQFEYFNSASHPRHRLARCVKTGVLIDCISSIGATIVPQSDIWLQEYEKRPRQEPRDWDQDSAYFEDIEGENETEETEDGALARSQSDPMTDVEAMRKCLHEVARHTSLVCSFRYVLLMNLHSPL